MKNKKRIAILGGGPSGLFMFKRLADAGRTDITIDIFEKKDQLGTGMPYSTEGAGKEHITNVSGNEIPKLVTSVADWIETAPKALLDKFAITPEIYNDYKVLPRLLFGQYLATQFDLLKQKADEAGIAYTIHYNSPVTDIIDLPEQNLIRVKIAGDRSFEFEQAIICTGHNWPIKHEGKVPGWFDSPYPPKKLALQLNHAVAIKGASLTAVDAIRTLARHNGVYFKNKAGKLIYQLSPNSAGFKMVMHSRHGMLPAVRFHLEDSHLQNDSLLTKEEIAAHIAANNGFLSLDFIFEKDFKEPIRQKQPAFYNYMKDMGMEQFVDAMMALRERADPFELMKAEYEEADRSIKKHESIYWKEMLGVLSFAMNYPAKHFSAEDMQRLQKTLLPLIAIVIAYIPQSSCEEFFALHDAGLLELVDVGNDSDAEPAEKGGAIYHYTDENGKKQSTYFKTYVDCSGQPHLSYDDFPYESLTVAHAISPAQLKFRDAAEGKKRMLAGDEKVKTNSDGNYYLKVPGVAINDDFRPVDEHGNINKRLYIMAVPYIGGYNPDYSGLDFCERASDTIAKSLFKTE
ncbi:MAG: FAD/NAD(P)-binding protein [Bacteroidota bacterium]